LKSREPNLKYITFQTMKPSRNTMIDEQLIAPKRQKNWGWPAALNFILGGAGAGGFILGSIFLCLAGNEGIDETKIRVFMNLTMFALVCVGFSALALEAGKPAHSYFLLRGFRNSWISRETFAFFIFVFSAIFSILIPGILIQGVAVLAALALMVSQGFILLKSMGVPAWHNPIVTVLIMSSGLSSGAGTALVLWSVIGMPVVTTGIVVAMFCALINSIVWLFYILWSKNTEFRLATQKFRRASSLVTIIGFGHLFPVLLLFFYLTASGAVRDGNLFYVLIAGLLLLVSSAWQKISIVFFAGLTQEIRLRY
jgi:phenylacetyl-CoA:acceptor oxidoreductase 26-kDa subunit